MGLHSNTTDEYVFCDNIVFNMPIYTYPFVFYAACYKILCSVFTLCYGLTVS